MFATSMGRSSRTSRTARNALHVESLEARLLLTGKALPELDFSISQFGSEEALSDYLFEQAKETYGHLFGQTTNWFPIEIMPPEVQWLAFAELDAAAPAGQAGTSSQTNVQVAGVDEADLVETDGRYIFIISHDQLSVIDTEDPTDLQLVGQAQFDESPTGMYLDGDRLTVISGNDRYWNTNGFSVVTVFDVTDRTNPSVVREIEIEGASISSRRIDDVVYLVNRHDFQPPAPYSECTGSGGPIRLDGPDVFLGGPVMADGLLWWPPDVSCTYETWEEYTSRYEDSMVAETLPQMTIYSPDGEVIEQRYITPAGEIYRPINDGHTFLTSIVAIDVSLQQPEVVASASIPGGSESTIYVSQEDLFVLSRQWGPEGSYTLISRVDIQNDAGSIELVANGAVPGTVLDQFSVDQYNGYLRIATTDATWNGGSDVYVVELGEESLEIVGCVEGIAEGEQLYAVRFLKDTGYLVTFLRIDPLFTLDLSDPTDPQITGELEIPGFSEFLLPIGEDHLVGLGRSTTVWSSGREQISLFDVSDPSGAVLMDRFTMDREGWSAANNDHHAIGYYPAYEILAIPFSENNWAADASSELLLFHVDVQDGLDSLGEIRHDSEVLRSVRIGGYLYSIAADSVISMDLDNPGRAVDELYYPPLIVTDPPGVNVGMWDSAPASSANGAAPTTWQQQHSNLQAIEVAFNHNGVNVSARDIRLTNLGMNVGQDSEKEVEILDRHVQAYGQTLRLQFLRDELEDGVYELTILPTATDRHGDPLDGNGDGVRGDAFVVTGSMENGLYQLQGDWNGDGGVSIYDFSTLVFWFGQPTVNNSGIAPDYVDLNRDGGVSIFDFPVFLQSFGENVAFAGQAVSESNAAIVLNPQERRRVEDVRDRQDQDSQRVQEVDRVFSRWEALARPSAVVLEDSPAGNDRLDERGLLEVILDELPGRLEF